MRGPKNIYMNIRVSNLSFNVLDAEVRKLFSPFGEVNSAVIIRDKNNGRSNGSALIDMVNDIQGHKAIACLNQTVVDGKVITVSELPYSIKDYKN
jgi:RNA recognition motif-containing protein